MALPIDISGKYSDILTNQGSGLNLDKVDQINDGKDRIITQSIDDPIVSDKQTIVDECSTVVDLPPSAIPQKFLRQMAGDQFWNLLPRDEQVAIKDSQTTALQGEIDKLFAEQIGR